MQSISKGSCKTARPVAGTSSTTYFSRINEQFRGQADQHRLEVEVECQALSARNSLSSREPAHHLIKGSPLAFCPLYLLGYFSISLQQATAVDVAGKSPCFFVLPVVRFAILRIPPRPVCCTETPLWRSNTTQMIVTTDTIFSVTWGGHSRT